MIPTRITMPSNTNNLNPLVLDSAIVTSVTRKYVNGSSIPGNRRLPTASRVPPTRSRRTRDLFRLSSGHILPKLSQERFPFAELTVAFPALALPDDKEPFERLQPFPNRGRELGDVSSSGAYRSA